MTVVSTTASWVALVVKNLSASAGDVRDLGLVPAHGITESDSTEQLTLSHFTYLLLRARDP